MFKRLSVFFLIACAIAYLASLFPLATIEMATADEVFDNLAPLALSPKPSLATAQIDPSAPSVVLLTPRFRSPAGPQLVATAELAGDRLLQEIAAAGLARVVDRTQLDRMLQERNLQASLPKPMLSYDAMVRMEIDASRLTPATMLSVIDLSTGNILKERKFGWPLVETDLPPILSLCREALKQVTKRTGGRLRVRTLWCENAISNERLRPLGKRLIEVFDASLQRSDRVILVRHLEAASSKEEAMLLLLGLSRLPGERRFSPQADATIELRLEEGDGQGKTFPETPVEIGVRLRKGADYQGDWTKTPGLVRDFDTSIPEAWRKLATLLRDVPPDTATTLLNEMTLRRKQAEAELQIVDDLRDAAASNRHDGSSRLRHLKAALEALPHAEAAAKLDPSSAAAAEAIVQALADISCTDYKAPRQMRDAAVRTIREAAHCIERFPQESRICRRVCEYANCGLCRSPLRQLLDRDERRDMLISDEDSRTVGRKWKQVWRATSWLTIDDEEPLVMTPETNQDFDHVRLLLEYWINGRAIIRSFPELRCMIFVIYHGMERFDVPVSDRAAWLEKISMACSANIARNLTDAGQGLRWFEYCDVQLRIVNRLIADKQIASARRIIIRTEEVVPAAYWLRSNNSHSIEAAIRAMGDDELLAGLEKRRQQGADAPRFLFIPIPRVDVFAGHGGSAINRESVNCPEGYDAPPLKFQIIRVRPETGAAHNWEYAPLAQGDGRLYFVRSQQQFPGAYPNDIIAYVPLDRAGRPVGKPESQNGQFWSGVQAMPQPNIGKTPAVTVALYVGGRLYLGTKSAGLHVFDPKSNRWQSYGPQQGLPSSLVQQMCPIGGQRLYCTAGDIHYTFDGADGAVKLFQILLPAKLQEPNRKGLYVSRWFLTWHDGGQLKALDTGGVWTDLLGATPTHDQIDRPSYGGWGAVQYNTIQDAGEAAGRLFFRNEYGLHEFAVDKHIVRSWWSHFDPKLSTDLGWGFTAPATCPLPRWPKAMRSLGSKLILMQSGSLVMYDVSTDTWFGPLGFSSTGDAQFVMADGVLWGATPVGDGLAGVPLDDAMQQAKAIGRVMTTSEYLRQRQAFVDKAPLLSRATLLITMRQFDAAKAVLQQLLLSGTSKPQALFLMGFLHDRDCLKQPADALKYYRQLTELPDDIDSLYTGMYYSMCVLKDCQRWDEAIRLSSMLLQRFPALGEYPRGKIQRIGDLCRRQLAKNSVKQSDAETSNKEEPSAK